MTRKRRARKQNAPPSFVQDMFNAMRSDPAIGPFAELIEDFIETGAYPGREIPYQGGRIEPFTQEVQLQIPPDMYRKLLMLCHPDKHQNSETSTEVTRWLIEQRKMYE